MIFFRTAIFLLPVVAAFGQYDDSAITGTVRDAQGRAVPDSTIRLQQAEAGLIRSARTTGAGAFYLNALPLGTWSLVAEHEGFREVRLTGIALGVGQTRTIDVTLPVGQRSDEVTIAAKVSEIDRASAAAGTRFEKAQVNGLPLNGRNWAALLPLVAGAVDTGTSDQRSVRFAGHGRDDNYFTFDGVDAGGISNQPQKVQIRLAIPTSSIAEFKVDAALFPAETGVGSGAQIVIASAGGTNAFHGDAFEFLRNNAVDARNPFSAAVQPFRLNQFGVDAGGPIVANRTFFYAAFEGLTQRLDQTLQGFTPSASYRAAAVQRVPSLAPLLNAFPVGTASQGSDATTDIFRGLSPQRADEFSGMVRFDQRFSERVTAFLRVNADESVTDAPLANLRDRTVADTRPLNGVFALNQAIGSPGAIQLLNETRFGFNQVAYRSSQITPVPFTVKVAGFTSVSSSRTREEDDTSASVIDNLTWTAGRHTLKTGVEVRRVLTNPGSSVDGTLTFANRTNLAADVLDSASVTATLPLKRLRKTQLFAFVQDEYRMNSEVTWNVGLRYSFFNVFHETQSRAVPFDFATCRGLCAPGADFSTPRTNDLDPRLSVAWAPHALHGRTVVRAGFGLYHGDGQLEDQNLPAFNDVPRYSLNSKQTAGLQYPIDSFLAGTPGILAPRAQNRNRKDEYASEWGFSVQQELPGNFVGTVGYSGNKGTDLQTITTANVPNLVSGVAPFPQYGQVEYRTNDSNSTFQALNLTLSRTLRAGWLMTANYMWSHSINDGSLGGGETDATMPQNVYCRSCERASSSYDIRHFFTVNSVYRIPTPAYLPRSIFGGWSLSGIGTARSARPVNITVSRAASAVPGGYTTNQRPNLVPGVPLAYPGGQTVAHWFNPAAFAIPAAGTFGNAGRGLGRGTNLYQVDLSVSRRMRVTERAQLEVRADAFNVLNRAQYGDPTGDVTVPAQFGIIQQTVNTTPIGTGTPRQIQFSLRLSF